MMNLRSVRRRCEVILRDVAIPVPFDVNTFAQGVSDQRGRKLALVVKANQVGLCGAWVATPGTDYVFYEAETSALHREHIILHELGHLLCGHEATELFDSSLAQELLPHLDPTTIERLMGRTTYSAVEEQEAEMLASLVRDRVERDSRSRQAHVAEEQEPVLRRFEATLDAKRAPSHG